MNERMNDTEKGTNLRRYAIMSVIWWSQYPITRHTVGVVL